MRLALIARADSRGLGNQTADLHRHMSPVSTICVDMSANTPYRQHFGRFPGAHVATPAELVATAARAGWFSGAVDVILTAETPYDYSLWTEAAAAKVGTVCQVNPEFWPYARSPDLPRPTIAVSPTGWLNHRMPDVRVLPHPVDRARFPHEARGTSETVTFLHVAGHKAMMDRNGTGTVMQALSRIRRSCRFVIRSQSPLSDLAGRAPQHVDVDVVVADLDDPADLYAGADVLVAPRRYGGQSLPLNEAASCGLALVVSDVDPQNGFVPPAGRVPCTRRRRFLTQGGAVDAWQADPRALAAKIDELVDDRVLLADLCAASDRYAASISWGRLKGDWLRLLAEAAKAARP